MSRVAMGPISWALIELNVEYVVAKLYWRAEFKEFTNVPAIKLKLILLTKLIAAGSFN